MRTENDIDRPPTLAEVTHLWWFADGAIMDGDTRLHLHRSWGLCTRHAWLYFRLETQLRIHPLGNAILMADLLARAANQLASRHSERHKRAALVTRDSCFTCEYAANNSGAADRFARPLAAVNGGSRTADWCIASQHVWQPRMCPVCAPRRDAAHAVVCRPHGVIDTTAPITADRAYVKKLAQRVTVCQKSMTHGGPQRAPDSDAALVEAIGWCAGWRPELATRIWA